VLTALLITAFALVPIGIVLARHYKTRTPSLQWPTLARLLNMKYEDNPPRISGQWNGRSISVEAGPTGVRAVANLSKPSRLRIEIGPRELVTSRSGMLVPDPAPTGDSAFDERFLLRSSDKAAGLKILDPVLRQRLMAQMDVDILGLGQAVIWTLPELKEPATLEAMLDVLTVISEEMERLPL
jgi:hypothetical protein